MHLTGVADDASSSDDDVPFATFLKKPQNDENPLHDATKSSTMDLNNNSGKDKSGPLCSDGSSDDDLPLTKLKCKQEKPVRKTSVPARRSTVLAGMEDTSDDEPLIKKTKTSSAAQKTESNGKKLDCTNGTDRSDEERLMSVTKVSSKTVRKTTTFNTDQKDETTASDDEPLIKKAKTSSAALKTESNGKKLDCTNGTENKTTDGSSVPARRSTVLAGMEDTSDDEPLINKTKTSSAALKTEINGKKLDCTNGTENKTADDSSEDEPLINIRSSLLAKKSATNDIKRKSSNGNSRMKKRADLTKEDSSDEEHLMGVTKVSSKTVRKPTTLKRGQKEVSYDNDSSSDEPLSELSKRHKAQQKRAPPVVTLRKTALRKKSKAIPHKQEYCDSSDDEPLMKKKTAKALSKERSPMKCNKRRAKTKVPLCSDGSSDDDVPLVKLICKQEKPVRTSVPARRSTVLGSSSDSSDDEPLINIKKTAMMKTASHVCPGSSSDSSDDEPLMKPLMKPPKMTKFLRVILQKCNVEAVTGIC